jgi:6-carboxyhexanoate--CoA ligase
MTEGKGRKQDLFSVRMHSSSRNAHLCGAERIVPKETLRETIDLMADRALVRGDRDLASISIRVDALDPEGIRHVSLLPIRTDECSEAEEAVNKAIGLLRQAGVTESVARQALHSLAQGGSPGGGNMRGAMLVETRTGSRMEPDSERGVRVTRMDLASDAREQLESRLADLQLQHPRVLDAVVLASKVAAIPGIVAEVCRSDDPDYTTGYVASRELGYVRIPNMKREGDPMGGRVFFIDGSGSLPEILKELEEVPYLITEIPVV